MNRTRGGFLPALPLPPLLLLTVLLLLLPLLLGVDGALVKIVREDHTKCGCPSLTQRQPRSDKVNQQAQGRVTLTTGRIFNGKPSRRGAWPWQVSLQLLHPKMGFVGHWCAGVLIEPTWVLTAAHCIHNELFNLPIGALWTAVVGEWELDSGNRGSARLPVDRIFIHERFNNYVHDIALMKLARAAPLSKVVRTICLPEAEEELADGHCVASGWGRYGPSPSLSNALLEATVPLLQLQDCLQAYGSSVPILNGHLCAGHTDGSSGSCVVINVINSRPPAPSPFD